MKHIFTFFILGCMLGTSAQNTVGTILNTEEALAGYTLFSPRAATADRTTYLMNNCGEVVNQWPSTFQLFSTDYLLEDGSLYRSVVDNQSTLDIPGNTGRIEHLSWQGTPIWAATLSDTDFSFHHDYVVLDNGNILLIVAFRKTFEEAITAGRDPSTIANNELYEERIWEIELSGNNEYTIVWEWRSWDHLIQDFDSSKENFGVVADHPELVDINYGVSFGEADWWHSNSLSYNKERDHITLSNRNLDEFIIIDHSTTTEEATTSSGGNSGMGGDILYRYGNPEAYGQGTLEDRQLDAMHDVHFIEEGLPNAGKIMIFNNGPDAGFTKIQIIDPVFDETTQNYLYEGGAYGPDTVDYEYSDPDNFLAAFLSGAQQLPNGNVLIANGPSAQIFEVDTDGTTVWEYQSPVAIDGILEDGQDAASFQTRIFRALKYPADYAAFVGRDLTGGAVIEQNPAEDDCTLLDLAENNKPTFSIYPNPVSEVLYISSNTLPTRYSLFDLSGKLVLSGQESSIQVQQLKSGIYLLQLHTETAVQTVKVIKE